jgi:type II secretion system protein N
MSQKNHENEMSEHDEMAMVSHKNHPAEHSDGSGLPGVSPLSEGRRGSMLHQSSLLNEGGKSLFDSSAHDEGPQSFLDKVRTLAWWRRCLGYVLLGIVSFIIFLYLTFPYAVVKEGLVGAVSDAMQQMGISARLNIGVLRPDWFTGVALENVTLVNSRDTTAQVRFGVIKARLNVLPLLLGRISVSAYVTQSGGTLDANFVLPIGGLIAGRPSLREGDLRFTNFQIDSFIGQALSIVKSSTNPGMATIIPLISVTSAGGFLSGKIVVSASDFADTDTVKGRIDLNTKQMFLHINDNVLQIPRQEFSVARIDATLDKGAVVFGNGTSFVAPDVDLTLGGRVGSSGRQGPVEANITLKLAMRRRIQENIGNIVPVMLKCYSPLKEKDLEDGKKEWLLDARIVGPIESFACEQI